MNRTVKVCSVQGCDKKHHGKSYCRLHYFRVRNNGSPNPTIDHHGLSKTKEYHVWASMIDRCYNEKNKGYKWYRGLEVYPEWRVSYPAFRNYMGPKPAPNYSLDRIDGTKGYIPGNVRWADHYVQARNQKMRVVNTSGYRGVGIDRNNKLNKWRAYISLEKKYFHLGNFASKEEAALAYDVAAIQLYGDEAKPNIL